MNKIVEEFFGLFEKNKNLKDQSAIWVILRETANNISGSKPLYFSLNDKKISEEYKNQIQIGYKINDNYFIIEQGISKINEDFKDSINKFSNKIDNKQKIYYVSFSSIKKHYSTKVYKKGDKGPKNLKSHVKNYNNNCSFESLFNAFVDAGIINNKFDYIDKKNHLVVRKFINYVLSNINDFKTQLENMSECLSSLTHNDIESQKCKLKINIIEKILSLNNSQDLYNENGSLKLDKLYEQSVGTLEKGIKFTNANLINLLKNNDIMQKTLILDKSPSEYCLNENVRNLKCKSNNKITIGDIFNAIYEKVYNSATDELSNFLSNGQEVYNILDKNIFNGTKININLFNEFCINNKKDFKTIKKAVKQLIDGTEFELKNTKNIKISKNDDKINTVNFIGSKQTTRPEREFNKKIKKTEYSNFFDEEYSICATKIFDVITREKIAKKENKLLKDFCKKYMKNAEDKKDILEKTDSYILVKNIKDILDNKNEKENKSEKIARNVLNDKDYMNNHSSLTCEYSMSKDNNAKITITTEGVANGYYINGKLPDDKSIEEILLEIPYLGIDNILRKYNKLKLYDKNGLNVDFENILAADAIYKALEFSGKLKREVFKDGKTYRSL